MENGRHSDELLQDHEDAGGGGGGEGGVDVGTGIKVSASALRILLTYWL
jgi:hypothetical protein